MRDGHMGSGRYGSYAGPGEKQQGSPTRNEPELGGASHPLGQSAQSVTPCKFPHSQPAIATTTLSSVLSTRGAYSEVVGVFHALHAFASFPP